MLLAKGTVVATTADGVCIDIDPGVACQACARHAGCGLGPLLTLFGATRSRSLTIARPAETALASGDRVQIALRGRRLSAFALLAYGLPLFGLLGGAVLAGVFVPGGGDGVAALGALAGALATWGLLRAQAARGSFDTDLAASIRRIS